MFKTKPNLFIVGAAKAGTTSLHHLLSKHPDVFMTAFKEPSYFCTDLHRESDKFHNAKKYFPIRTADQYSRLFEDIESEKIIGESSPDYLYSAEAASNIYHFNSDAKIIIMLREPLAQMKSLFLELYSGLRGDDVKTIEKALELEPARKSGRYVPQTARMPSSLFYKRNAHYLEFIRVYFKVFPRKNIHFILLENIMNNPVAVREELFNFLNINQLDIPIVVQNTRYDKFYLRNKKILTPVVRTLKPYQKRIPNRILLAVKNLLQISNIKRMTFINEKLLQELVSEFKSEVEELSKITGKDLKKIWNFN